ncbi:single-stranded-DNA-specific exonuclease RecJ [Bacteroidota bacterium]
MRKEWLFREDVDTQAVDDLAESLMIDKILAKILIQRDVRTYDQANYFFRPSLLDLHDPFLMKDMDIALERIDDAINSGESVLIYGDYDVDGTTSVAMLYSFFRAKFKRIEFYIPDRYLEGYGISKKGIEYAHENNFSLIIAIDCGIKAIEEIKYAREKMIDVIICDHHFPDEELPDAVAILNPKRADCDYPFKLLSGCGVGFKLLQAFSSRNDIHFKKLEVYLDLLCVSIASDLVPIIGENRIFAYHGLKRLRKNPRLGFTKMLDRSGSNIEELTINDISFKIGPKINAAGRMDSGRKAVELLIVKGDKLANELLEIIEDHNDSRKLIDSSITETALKELKENQNSKNLKAIVLYNKDWHKGVIGIVASRLIEVYYRPTIILAKSNGMVTGSGRSVEGFDIYKAIESCSEYLETFGGHKYAAGLTLKEGNLEGFKKSFENYVENNITIDQLKPRLLADTLINISDITPKFLRVLKQFGPFGIGNANPVFITKNVVGTARKVGKENEHLKLEIRDADNNFCLSGIAFKQADGYDIINKGIPFNICYTLEENTYNNIKSIQLMILDIQNCESD